MTTADPLAPFQWLNTHNSKDFLLGEIFTVAFFRGLDPSEVVRRFSCGEDYGQESTFNGLTEKVREFVGKTDGGYGGGSVGVLEVGEWSVAIELFGWMGTLHEVLAELSRGCEVLAITRHDYAEHSLEYAIDGTIVTGYRLTRAHDRYGSEPDRLNGFMRELGMALDTRDDESDWDTDYHAAVPRAFALAAKVTQVRFTSDMLSRAMLVGPVAYR
ncbi:DUF6461 domain-containing protein [Nocardia sp. KC 131]|uniref:DUF6461 domain-containing protein n=1 Tax=Nocardia arseniciresistens TaxID=3392119 RepID=UPI00398F770B